MNKTEKQAADRMLEAVKALNEVVWTYLTDHGADYEAMSELYNAAMDYEKQTTANPKVKKSNSCHTCGSTTHKQPACTELPTIR